MIKFLITKKITKGTFTRSSKLSIFIRKVHHIYFFQFSRNIQLKISFIIPLSTAYNSRLRRYQINNEIC